MTLTAEVVARGPFPYPLAFALELPAEATLATGEAQASTGPLGPGDVVHRSWTVRYERAPDDDAWPASSGFTEESDLIAHFRLQLRPEQIAPGRFELTAGQPGPTWVSLIIELRPAR